MCNKVIRFWIKNHIWPDLNKITKNKFKTKFVCDERYLTINCRFFFFLYSQIKWRKKIKRILWQHLQLFNFLFLFFFCQKWYKNENVKFYYKSWVKNNNPNNSKEKTKPTQRIIKKNKLPKKRKSERKKKHTSEQRRRKKKKYT